MSRTRKDKPSKLLWGDYFQDHISLENYHYRLAKTTKPKVRKTKNTEWAWIHGTPSWWNNLFHTRPIRNKFKAFGTKVVGMKLEIIEDMLEPSDSNKPHKYYW